MVDPPAAIAADPPAACPRCGYERRAHDIAPLTECARCGVIFAKLLASQAQRTAHSTRPVAAPTAAAPTAPGLWARLTYVPEKVDGTDVAGRAALWVVLLLWGGSFLRLPYDSQKIIGSFLHGVHLVFHEAGHVIFAPFGRFMHILGGSLMQVLMPAIVGTVALLRYRNPFAGAVCLWWCGHAILDLAPYVADARILDMPLIGETADEDADLRAERHDWRNLLLMMGRLQQDKAVARGFYWVGALLMGAALVYGAWLLVQQRRRITKGYLSPTP